MGKALLERLMTRIAPELFTRLATMTSAFESEIAQRQLEGQIRTALLDTLVAVGLDEGLEPVADDHAFDELIGRERAGHGIHPSESLTAVTELFDLAYPALVDLAPEQDAAELGRALHGSIMHRLVPAAIGYVDVLLNQVHGAQMESRLKLAQDLHDRIAHGVGVGVQGIQIALLLLEADPEEATRRLNRTETHLSETLEMVREMSGKLREAVGPRSLAQALRDYLDVTAPPAIGHTVVTRGDLGRLPPFATEETYLILREAARNAMLHATGATSLHIVLEMTDRQLTAQVVDDGEGFEPADHENSSGLRSMQDRARLVRGALTVVSGRGRGTQVQLEVPVGSVLVSQQVSQQRGAR